MEAEIVIIPINTSKLNLDMLIRMITILACFKNWFCFILQNIFLPTQLFIIQNFNSDLLTSLQVHKKKSVNKQEPCFYKCKSVWFGYSTFLPTA